MTKLQTVDAVRRILPEEVKIWDYSADFNELWNLESLNAAHAIVVWADTPGDPEVYPVATEPHLTPFDWAIAACSQGADLRVTILDLRDKEHDEAKYAALQWLRTQRPECVSWLRRVVMRELLGSSAADLRSLLTAAPATPDGTPTVTPRDALKLLPVCRVDLTRDASHHAIANLVGPLMLLRTSEPPRAAKAGRANHREALRQVLLAAGLAPSLKPPGGASGLEDRGAAVAKIPGKKELGELRVVLCDDQWRHGWLDWACERTGATAIPDRVLNLKPDDSPHEVACGDGISVWVSSGADWLLRKLKDLPLSTHPLRRRLRLTDGTVDHNELLLLDLRLFAGDKKREQHFLNLLHPLHEKFNGDAAPVRGSDPTGSPSASAMPTDEALSLLPRTLALADPLLPIVLFSSTGRRDVIKMLSDYPSVVTSFAKPRLLGDGSDDLRTATEEAFDRALEEGVHLVRRRRVVGDLQAARTLAASGRRYENPVHKHIGIYVDESGRVVNTREPFVMAGIVAFYQDKAHETQFLTALEKQVPGLKRKGNAIGAESRQDAANRRREVAEQVLDVAGAHSVLARGVAIVLGKDGPAATHYGPRADWADLALDRTHRVLLKQVITASLVYAVGPGELEGTPTCNIRADARSVPMSDIKADRADVEEFGYTPATISGGLLWRFLNPSSVYPIVDAAFCEDPRLQRFRVVGAMAFLKFTDRNNGTVVTHPLLDWADHLAAEIRSSIFWLRDLPGWALSLLEPPGIYGKYDADVDRLLRLARVAAAGQPASAVEDLVHLPDACTDRSSQGLANRCRAYIADELERSSENPFRT